MVDCRKQQPQQMTTIIGTLGGFIKATCVFVQIHVHVKRMKFYMLIVLELTLKFFLTSNTTNVPDIGQMHLVMFSIKFSVMHKSVLQLGSYVALVS
jgi:hypothetical protein